MNCTTTHLGSKIETRVSSNNIFKDRLSPRFDWGIGFRAGVEIVRHAQIAIGYDWGMKNTYMNDPETKNRTFVVSLTYYF